MKKAVAFLLAFLIFFTPMTTLVKADVVIGDNDNIIVNENASILGRKLALMESLSDLALSGVTDFTITNTNDVDSYLDYLWEEIDDAIESLSDGTGFTEISNNLKSRYFTNLVQYKDYIINRGNYLAQLLPSGNPTTSLLSTFFANNVYGKQYTEHYDLALDMFRSLNALTNDDNNVNPDSDYLSYIDIINGTNVQADYRYNFLANNYLMSDNSVYQPTNIPIPFNGTYYCVEYGNNTFINSPLNTQITFWNVNLDLYINSTNFSYYVIPSNEFFRPVAIYGDASRLCNTASGLYYNSTYNAFACGWWKVGPDVSIQYNKSGFNDLNQVFNNICQRWHNINIYVDNIPWSIVSSSSSNNPTLDIDGIIKIYGNDNPQQYQLQPNTKIDYDQLYQVIYNAIRDNLPISQGDINYYDSHDTIYSPTIINNYGEEDGEESDLIDTILDYAVIPKFDTAIAQPMRAALTNGVVIMNNSITNVIPNEILLILGACFFLLLFAVVINRMIK